MGAIRDFANQVYREFARWSASFPLPIGDPRSKSSIPQKPEIRALFSVIDDAVAAKANLDSPAFTGSPQVPTAPSGSDDYAPASTEWVRDRIAEAALSAGSGQVVGPGTSSVWDIAAFDNALGTLARAGGKVDITDRIADVPTLDLLFDDLAGLAVGSRLSTATCFDARAALVTIAANVPRITWDPETLRPDGLLLEPGSTNLLTWTQDFRNTATAGATRPWTYASLTVTPDTTTAPDGTTTADTLVEAAATANHDLTFGGSFVSGTAYTLSWKVKAAGRTTCLLAFPSAAFTGSPTAQFNLSTGAVITTTAGATAGIKALPGGWYRIWMTATATATASGTARIRIGTGSYAGDGTSGIHSWGAQLEASPFPTSYIPTTTATVTRAADSFSIPVSTEWFNTAEGVLFVDFTPLGLPATADRFVQFDDGTTANRMGLRIGSDISGSDLWVDAASSNVVDTASNTVAGMTRYRAAFAYKADDFSLVQNGGTAKTDTGGAVPTGITRLLLAGSTVGIKIHRIAYWPKRLTDQQMQALTVA